MSNARKKISELTALTSASLDTVVVGVDNGTTYKIELDVLADGVRDRINTLDYQRLNSLETFTASVNNTSLNAFTSSQLTTNTTLTNNINGRLTTSSFETFSQSVDGRILAATNEQSFNGLISGSSQLTASYDSRYVLSGSITQTTWDNISGKPNGLVSQSTDLTSLNSFTSSYYTDSASFSSRIDAATNEQSLSHLVTTSSFNSYTASISTASLVDRLNIIENTTSSYETKGSGILSGSISYTSLTNIPSGIISQSVDLTSLNQFTASISTESLVNRLNIIESVSSSWITENETGSFLTSLNGAISSSSQLTASYDTRYTLSGSVSAVPAGTISGSAQITAFGFVSSSTSVPAGTISGSSQLTSSFDGRYVQTGSFNTLTASFNSFTASAQAVTTGSNSFNGTQTITGSLIITTGSFVGSQILANTSSLYLTSGSNMYVQNNGIVEITGSLIVSGTTRFATVGGDEGGEIEFGVPQTNTTLSTSVKADIYQNRFRIFDGNTNGVYIDLSKAPTGVNGEITWKTSGYVNAGTFVQLDNVKVTIPTSGNRGASIGAVSTSFTANISATFGNSAGTGGNAANTVSYTTTAAASAFGWNFGAAGDAATYILNDTTNSRVYRIITMIGTSYNNNFISIERLH